jgi:hypothetical protein
VGEIISIYRIKTFATTAALEARFAQVEKVPPKARELRGSRPESKFAGHETDAAAGFGSKFAYRLRKNAKLRFFRVFKLLDEQKAAPDEAEASQYRSVAERIQRIRWMRRL